MTRRFVVIGAGGIGTWLCQWLVRLLEYKDPGSGLLIVDGDHFEDKNRERQGFSMMGAKAEVLASELGPMFPQTLVIPVNKWVVDAVESGDEETELKITGEALLAEDDVVFCVVDNFACRKVVFDAARHLHNIDVFTGGNDDAMFASIYHYQRRDGADITDHPAEWHPEFIDPPDRNPGQLSCQERAAIEGGTQFLVTNAAAAVMLLAKAQLLITDDPAATAWHEMFMELGVGKADAINRNVEIDVPVLS